MTNMKLLLLGFLIAVVKSEENCNTPSYPDINTRCQCDPSSSNPLTVRCVGQNLVKFPSLPPATHTLHIEKCSLPEDKLTTVPGTAKDLQGLFIRQSGIKSIDAHALHGMNKLVDLGLENNMLTTVTPDTFHGLPNVAQINLSNNSIGTIEPEAFNLSSLTALNLSTNQIADLPTNTFGTNSLLRSIDLDSNKLFNLPDGLGQLEALETLNIRQNKITDLGAGRLLYSIGLTEIHADNNYVTRIGPKAFDGLAQLKTLHLGNNQLLEISPKAFEVCVSTIKEVSLQNNRLTSLKENTLPWKSLTTLRIEGNPWACECDLRWLMTENKNMKYGNLTCDSPDELKGKPLEAVDQEVLNCPTLEPEQKGGLSKTHLFLAIAIPAGVVLLIIIIVVIICCRRKRGGGGEKSVKYSAVYKPTTEQKV